MLTLNSKEALLLQGLVQEVGIDVGKAEFLGMSFAQVDELIEKFENLVSIEDTWLTRLKQDVEDLDDKLQELTKFYETETYKNLEGFDKSMLHFQHCAMSSYHHALQLRYLKASENV